MLLMEMPVHPITRHDGTDWGTELYLYLFFNFSAEEVLRG